MTASLDGAYIVEPVFKAAASSVPDVARAMEEALANVAVASQRSNRSDAEYRKRSSPPFQTAFTILNTREFERGLKLLLLHEGPEQQSRRLRGQAETGAKSLTS